MCGIAGELRFNDDYASVAAVRAMCRRMAARGPHGEGVFAHNRIALGHRRLKIIDLSDRAMQPLVDPALGLTTVFNGCIYNYRQLRTTLEDEGYRFFTDGDTEVIGKAWHAWGTGMFERFNGMFAIAIWERDTGRVILARDRLGIKPLYYSEFPDGMRFCSSLPGLVAAGGVDTDIDPIALHHYMSFHAVVPAPHTILAGVRKLPPASVMTIAPDGKRTVDRFWGVDYEPRDGDADRSEDEWRDALLAALRRAVERRLVADVPVGVLLSGGVDSSLIVGLLAEAGAQDLNTFSIGFETVNDEAGDEFQYSDLVAARFGTRHHQLFVDSGQALSDLRPCVEAMNEPMVSHDNLGFFKLSQAVARHVRVVQSGQGADEVFGGYHWYPPLLDSTDPVGDYAKVFFDRTHAELMDELGAAYIGADYSRAFVRDQFAAPGARHPIDMAMRLDTTIMLVDDPVKRVDSHTMAWGLEARVPFLDHEVVELAARMPAALKVRGEGKYILKQAAREIIPAAVINRPKGYFPVPALKYLRGDILEFVRGVLDAPRARERGLFRRAYIDRLLREPEQHITPLGGSKLWQAALLEFWLQTHIDGVPHGAD